MKKIIILFSLAFLTNISYSQLVVSNVNTVAYYVQNVLLGSGVTVSNITFNGLPANVPNSQMGEFNAINTSPYLGIDSGIVLATGDINVAVGPNNSGSASLGGGSPFGDVDLDVLIGGAGSNDAAILEFDFIPTGDTVLFKFVFGSEEYPEYVFSINDAFGFFLSGPGIVGPFTNSAINIALIPSTTTPVTINNINATTNSSYYIDNTVNTGPQSIQFDGYTTVMTAVALVQCGLQFHIKIAIADASDTVWDSGVFLEGGSFSSNSTLSALNAVVPPDVTLCNAPYVVNFSAGPTPPPLNYWDFGDGLGTDSIANPSYTYADTGTYVVTYIAMDSSSCIGSDTAYFTVNILLNDSLDAQFNIPTPDPCADSMLVEMAFTGTGADSLFWDMGNGTTFINNDSISYYYTIPGVYYVTFEAYDTICGQFFTLTDTVNFTPVMSTVTAVAPPQIILCSSPYNVNFTGNVPVPPQSYWDFGDGLGTDTSANPLYTYADTGTYNVMYVVIDSSTCNIADTAYFTVIVAQADSLDAQFLFPPYDPCVDSLTIQLDFTGSGADSLFWDMGNGSSFVNDTSISYTFTTPGTYIITFEAYDFFCNNSVTILDTVNFNPVMTSVNAVVPPNILLCNSPYEVNFTGNNPSPPNCYWDFGDGIGTSTQCNPSYTYSTSGIYIVTYVAIDSSTCNIADTATFNVQVTIAPLFTSTVNFEPPKPCEADSFFVALKFAGVGADSIQWNMGDGTVLNTDSVYYLYSGPGTYNIVMTAFNDLCGDKIIPLTPVEFVAFSETTSIIPNVFSPNGDGMNDELEFVGVDETNDYSIKIYNRWGRKMYEGTNSLAHWDGKGAAEGVYFYELIYTDVCSDEEKLVTGYVTLFK